MYVTYSSSCLTWRYHQRGGGSGSDRDQEASASWSKRVESCACCVFRGFGEVEDEKVSTSRAYLPLAPNAPNNVSVRRLRMHHGAGLDNVRASIVAGKASA